MKAVVQTIPAQHGGFTYAVQLSNANGGQGRFHFHSLTDAKRFAKDPSRLRGVLSANARNGETTMTNILSILILAAGYGLCAFVMGLALALSFS